MSMFEKFEKMIIVHSNNTTAYANYLQLLISSDEKNIAVKTTIWTEKEYLANKPSLSSSEHILFIGKGKVVSKEYFGMETKYNQCGMVYGWLGRRAFANVSSTPMQREKIEEFVKYAKQYDPEIEFDKLAGVKAEINDLKENEIGSNLKNSGRAVLLPIFGEMFNLKDRVKNEQYKCLIIAFYKEGLAKFLEM